MTIFPAIDIRGGRCVRLTQGKAQAETVYFEDPAKPARQYRDAGATWVHVVDLDGAFTGQPANLAAVQRIADLGLQVQFGGGLRSVEVIEQAFAAGVTRVVVGTRACQEPDFARELAETYGAQVAVGIDAKNGQVAVRGWVDTTDVTVNSLAETVSNFGIRTVIYTDIATDGMLTGPNFAAQAELMSAFPSLNVIASGGVSAQADLARFAEMSKTHANLEGVIVGKAIYEGRIDVASALSAAR
ncbi:MAG: 1-(5-phosphoribosyl)-5-[(5-phosphoribosylamino)methylideneamino]imidazole-4-carboxamide isomerase [Opitutales bacterium]